MTMSDVKLVKVDNWGIYFLQRLKHFFNRTDYCDLTLQFQDNAQLKVHRLVLSACTEYFELLERTCEMYEDCLVMPDDLQADVVVPIVNFMYTGQLEFKTALLDRLCQTSEIMNMPVLTKLLNSHRPKQSVKKHMPLQSYPNKRAAIKESDVVPLLRENSQVLSSATLAKGDLQSNKRSYSKAFSGEKSTTHKDPKLYEGKKTESTANKHILINPPVPEPLAHTELLERKMTNKKQSLADPRPTRYELPEELDTENVFENSFSNISYTSQPLMIHPETQKKYSKRPRQIGGSSTKKFMPISSSSTMDIVECKRISKDQVDNIFEDTVTDGMSMDPLGVNEMFTPFVKVEQAKDSSQLFDQILDQSEESVAKVSIETPKNKKTNVANLDHAKIISEVLKKYPHLVKSNKNIKLKILNTPTKSNKKPKASYTPIPEKPIVLKTEPIDQDYTYEADVLDSKQAARLIALGAENIDGPWICLICGTPGRALQFTSYYKYRRHLVEVHKEKPVLTICEYCGHKLNKRNYLLFHMYTKHGIEPPPQYHFPKCPFPKCDYIALSEALLTKHKISHGDGKNYRNYVALTEAVVKSKIAAESNRLGTERSFQCYVCSASFKNSSQLLAHIQATDHKFKKPNLQCIYCNKTFLRETNLYAHLQIHHKAEITRDGLVDDSDDESESQPKADKPIVREIKSETPANDYEEVDIQYQIQQRPDGIHVVTKKPNETSPQNTKHKILNSGFSTPEEQQKPNQPTFHNNEFMQTINISKEDETPNEIIMIDNTEYIMKGNKLTRTNRRPKEPTGEFILPDIVSLKPNLAQNVQTVTLPIGYSNINSTNIQEAVETTEINSNIGQPISIYVSNEEEYKAIMSANHPIIFDADDTSKSLTVLTAPPGETLETTIDLNNTQTNEMMVIQDGFPLNVSQAISSENQNIVVVYSNQVDQTGKGYQLLSTQLDPQFANTSAIITQNFETVTTSTPIMSAHVLDTQIGENWQTTTIHQDSNDKAGENPAEIVIQQTIPTNEVDMTNSVDQNIEMVSLPETDMTRDKEDSSQMSRIENITTQIIQEPLTDQVVTAVQVVTENLPTENLSFMSVDEEIPSEEIIEETVNTENSTEVLQSDSVITNHEELSLNDAAVSQTEAHEIIEQDVASQNMDTENLQSQTYTPEPEEAIDESLQQTSELVDETVASEPIIKQSQTESTEVLDQPIEVLTTNVVDEATVEKIHSLASEWSEEDSETTSQDIAVDTTNKESPEIETEIEESIENIQQEVQQFSGAQSIPSIPENNVTTEVVVEHGTNVAEDDTKLHENIMEEHKNDTTKELPVETPTAKISSLLNDWEDNDSQDEGTNENEDVENETAELTENETAEVTDNQTTEVTENETAEDIENETAEDNENETAEDIENETAEVTGNESAEVTENECTEVIENTEAELENPEQEVAVLAPQDKIKSLVSDWDEEEDENK